jgi:transposase
VVGVEQWAEIRRMHFVGGLSQREIRRRTGLHRDTIRRAIAAEEPPVYRRPAKGSKLDEFKPEIHRLLGEDPKLPGQRIRELLEPLGCSASKTVVDDYLREVRPLFAPPPRTFQRTSYRPGEICQFDVWQPREEVPVGRGQTRQGWVVVACLGYSRAGAGVLVFSKETDDLLAGIAGCLTRLGALPKELVWDRQAGIHGHQGRPSEAFAAFCGQLKVAWRFCEPADPQAKGAVERLQGYAETNFEPGRRFANDLDFQDQLDAWFTKVNARTHKMLRARPVDRLAEEHQVMAPLPPAMPTRPSVGSRGSRRIRTCAWTPTTTRWTRSSWVAASRSAPASARSGRSSWTPARSPAPISGCSPSTARSPRSSTPARCAKDARRPRHRSRSGRSPATTS